jgi:hypothetical protein
MENAFNEFVNEVVLLFGKFSTYIFGITIGLLGKLSYEIYMKRTLNFIQWTAVVGMSVFTGYVTSVYCNAQGFITQAQFIVPLATLMGEKFFIYLIENHKQILDMLLSWFKPKTNETKRKKKV